MDALDIKILDLLQSDAKITIKEMAKQLHLTTTPVFDRIKRMEKRGIIDKYVTLINPNKLDKKLIVFVDLTITDHSLGGIENFVNYMIQFPEVMECHHITGDADVFIKILLKDMEAYNQFVLKILSVAPNVGSVRSRFSLSTRKSTTHIALSIK
jgi:DNA-binding Lrp family transcriptional regulator